MKVASGFGMFLVFAAVLANAVRLDESTKTCVGDRPSNLVPSCRRNDVCAYEHLRGFDDDGKKAGALHSCGTPDNNVDCSQFSNSADKCIRHQCSVLIKIKDAKKRKARTECSNVVPKGINMPGVPVDLFD